MIEQNGPHHDRKHKILDGFEEQWNVSTTPPDVKEFLRNHGIASGDAANKRRKTHWYIAVYES